MTEDEAMQKWCPILGLAGAAFASAGRVAGGPKNCIGSACMLWRWDVEKCRKGPEVDHGYCGLAGKP